MRNRWKRYVPLMAAALGVVVITTLVLCVSIPGGIMNPAIMQKLGWTNGEQSSANGVEEQSGGQSAAAPQGEETVQETLPTPNVQGSVSAPQPQTDAPTPPATLEEGGPEITLQPQNTSAECGETGSLSVTANGVGITYEWYRKNVGESDFVKTSVTAAEYPFTMDAATNGAVLYCVVTDNAQKSVQSASVTLTAEHKYNDGVVTRKPSCVLPGETTYTCVCSHSYTKPIKAVAHEMGDWTVFQKPTAHAEGIERQSCANCTHYVDRALPKVAPLWYITADLGTGKTQKIGVGEDGLYYLTAPKRDGYKFVSWQTAEGQDFDANGTISGDTVIKALWEVADTDSAYLLTSRTEKGIDKIKITKDIVINKPIYISHDVTIYADSDVSIKRHPDYTGDLFVIGKDKKGNSAPAMHRKAVLTLGGGQGTLTIDGNADAITKEVVGSALFVCDTSTLNLYDGVKIANHKKTGNERIFTTTDILSETTAERAGGAAIVNLSSTVYMYGGVIENNIVVTQYTPTTDAAGNTVDSEIAGCGGAVFNNGDFHMHGGIIKNNEALRGGGIYNNRFAYLVSGTVADNLAHTHGGGLSTSSSATADTFLGAETADKNMVFSGNRSMKAGGAMYSNTNAPIIIYGHTEFNNNKTDTSGGAIYTGGPLTVRGATFNGNECVYSGGAIYHHYSNPDRTRRFLVLQDTAFAGNRASLGGAVILSAPDHSKEMGTFAEITGCTFTENEAFKNESNNGNGGAIYVTRKSEAKIADCTFTRNKAHTNAGAIAMHSQSKIDLPRCTFIENEASLGGALYMSSNVEVNTSDLRFEGNRALKRDTEGGNGGAVYANEIQFNMKNFDFIGNSAEGNGGAVYMYSIELTPDADCSFENNHADGHGGVFYLTYKKSGNVNYGSVLNLTNQKFVGNSAMAGGAISIRTDCKAIVKDTTFENNAATGLNKGAEGGGAIYVGYGELIYENNTAKGNTSAGYGGVIKTLDTDLDIAGCTFEENEAGIGGALCLESSSDLKLSNSSFVANKSTFVQSGTYDNAKGGGAITIYGATLDIDDVTFDANESKYYGGTLLASGTTVSIDGETRVCNSVGQTGAALMFKSGCTVTLNDLEVLGTDGKGNGVIYQNGGTLTVNRLNAHDNTSYNGGVFYTSGGSTVVNVNDGELVNNTATNNGGVVYMDAAAVTLNDCNIQGNTAKNGGAIYDYLAKLQMNALTFEENKATKNGGVLALIGVEHTLEEGLTFIKNEAGSSGGVVYAASLVDEEAQTDIPATLHLSDYTFSEHKGGVVSVEGTSSTADITNCTFTDNSGVNGGVLNVNGATVSLTKSTLKNNTATLGGAIYDMAGKLTVSELVLENNKANNNGGAICLVGAKLDIDDSITFTSNSAQNHGGAIYVTYQTVDGKTVGAVLNVRDNTFVGHTAKGGGAVSIRSACEATFTDTSFVSNSVSGFADTDEGDGEGGGAIYVGYGKLTLNNTTFAENKALATETEGSVGNGGAVSIVGATVEITGTTFEKNEAGTGGALNVRNNSVVTVKDSEFKVNTSTFGSGDSNQGGGAVKTSGSTLTFNNVVFDGNASDYYGGALVASSSTVTMDHQCALTNSLGTTGGAIYVKYNSTLNLQGINLNYNTARTSGVIYVNGATVNLNHVSAKYNKAAYGGVLSCTGGATITVNGGLYTDNTAMLGGVFNVGATATLNIQDAVFENNKAEISDGAGGNGAVLLVEGGSATVTGETKFINNTADNHGGAVYVTYKTEGNERIGGTLHMTNGLFENNTAASGGAISARTDASVTLNSTKLISNTASAEEGGTGGGAIFANANTLSLTNVTLEQNTTGYYGGAVMTLGSSVTMENTTVKNNEGITGAALYFNNGGQVKLTDVSVTDTVGNGSGVIYVSSTTTLAATRLTATANRSNNGGVFYLSGSGNVTIKDSTLTGNTAQSYGGAIDHRGSSAVEIINTEINDNTAKNGGAIYSQGGGSITVSDSEINGNTATELGGAIYKCKAGTLKVTDTSSIKENTAKTGAIYVDETASVIVENSVVENNTATDSLGRLMYVTGQASGEFKNLTLSNIVGDTSAIYAEGATLSLTDVTAANNKAHAGGLVHATEGSVLNIVGGEYKENEAAYGGVAYAILESKVNISNATFTDNTATTNGGAIYISGADVVATGNNAFVGNSAVNHGGAIYIAYTKHEGSPNRGGTITMTDGIFENNTALGGGAVSLRSDCEGEFTNTVFTANSVSGFADIDEGDGEGGGAIYVGYGKLTLNNTTFTENTSLAIEAEGSVGNGGAISIAGADVEITGAAFENNEAGTGGALNARSGSVITVKDSAFKANTASFGSGDNNQGGGAVKSSGSTLTFDNTVFDGNTSDYYAGTILASSTTLTLENGSEVKNSLGTTGGALFIKSGTTATLNSADLSNNTANNSGIIYNNGATLHLTNVTATNNTASFGGIVSTTNGAKVNISGGTYSENTAQLGGVAYLQEATTLDIQNATFTNNKAVKNEGGSNGNGAVISIAGANVTATGNNRFAGNTAENHGGAIYVSYKDVENTPRYVGTLTMTDGVLENNTAAAGGAISARTDCITTLTGTKLSGNTATADTNDMGGGAIYTNGNTMTLSGVTLDGNKTGYYGGAITGLGANITIKDNSVISNNQGVTGVAVHVRNGGKCVMNTVTMSGNKAIADGSGVIYITGNGTLDITALTASANQNNNGAVLYSSGTGNITVEDSVFSGNVAKNYGGVFDHRGSSVMTVSNTEFGNNTAKFGGAIFSQGGGNVTFSACTFTENTATEQGGAIYKWKAGTLKVTAQSVLKKNTAKSGGAVYVDQGATVTIENSTLEENTATAGDGGAVTLADSTKDAHVATTLNVSGATFKSNSASVRGGAISTDGGSPELVMNVTGSTFEKNKANGGGGGAVEIRNGNQTTATAPSVCKIVLKGCTFTANEASSSGGVVEIRESSYAKIDGITATDNTSGGNGAVVYITSNHSRLFLTGDVTVSGNTAKGSGNFAYLYNSNYADAPAIYTTHSNTAAWMSDIKMGSTTANKVHCDLTTLP